MQDETSPFRDPLTTIPGSAPAEHVSQCLKQLSGHIIVAAILRLRSQSGALLINNNFKDPTITFFGSCAVLSLCVNRPAWMNYTFLLLNPGTNTLC